MVLTWHPILELSETDVWQQIADAALEYHPVYDAVSPRLSCVFCVLACARVVTDRAGKTSVTAAELTKAPPVARCATSAGMGSTHASPDRIGLFRDSRHVTTHSRGSQRRKGECRGVMSRTSTCLASKHTRSFSEPRETVGVRVNTFGYTNCRLKVCCLL
ncbi:phosphoadenosine phosphosulfate reductase family protein [Streptomyces sp. BF23-19]|uniref:phosphoadenosine phosphosulfate reductase domain-containing protein n=1 Tax=unclassified Streptomyces TaxID=2593676 RepID=UPI0034E527B7